MDYVRECANLTKACGSRVRHLIPQQGVTVCAVGVFRVRILALLAIAAAALFLMSTMAEAQADKKVALVIGNSRYANEATLANPHNDAEDMAEVLSRIGFKVMVKFDLDYNSLRNSLMEFTQLADQAEIAAVFYAGHGIEMTGTNYLIPVDARLDNESQIAFQALPLDLVLNSVSGASRLRIVFLDACRNNPFLKKIQSKLGTSRSALGRGLAPIEPNEGTVVAFAAKDGTTASDGAERNSPFTKALLKHIVQPGLDVDFLLRHVRDDVLKETDGKQEPYKYGSLPAESMSLAEAEGRRGGKTETRTGCGNGTGGGAGRDRPGPSRLGGRQQQQQPDGHGNDRADVSRHGLCGSGAGQNCPDCRRRPTRAGRGNANRAQYARGGP